MSSKGSSFINRHKDVHRDVLKKRLRRHFNVNIDRIKKALMIADSEQKGTIHICMMRNIVESFCFPFTDYQWNEIISDFNCPDMELRYSVFVNHYSSTHEEVRQRWIRKLDQAFSQKQRWEEPVKMCDSMKHLKEVTNAKRVYFLKAFLRYDPDGTGAITKKQFHRIVSALAFRLNDFQFQHIWREVPKDKHGRVRYVEFLQRFGCWSPTKFLERNEALKLPKIEGVSDSGHPGSLGRTKLPRLFDADFKADRLGKPSFEACYQIMRKFIGTKWREIIKYCAKLDKEKRGTVTGKDFREILIKIGLPLREDSALNYMACKQGACTGAAVNYCEFIRPFLIYEKAGENAAITALHKIQKMRQDKQLQLSHSVKIPVRILLLMRRQVLQNWKSLSHFFRRADYKLDGIVELVDFDRIIRQHGILLKEEEMFELLECLDPNISGNVCYMDFMGYFSHDLYN